MITKIVHNSWPKNHQNFAVGNEGDGSFAWIKTFLRQFATRRRRCWRQQLSASLTAIGGHLFSPLISENAPFHPEAKRSFLNYHRVKLRKTESKTQKNCFFSFSFVRPTAINTSLRKLVVWQAFAFLNSDISDGGVSAVDPIKRP